MQEKYIVSPSPHIRKKDSTSKIMWSVTAALIPAGAAGVFIFGLKALWVIGICVVTAVLTEALILTLRKQKITILDGSAVLTGLLLAYNLPSGVPFWIPVAGTFFAIAVGKQSFGGLGRNIFNPALVGRAFLLLSWPKYMTRFVMPFRYDGITSATPLAVVKEGLYANFPNYWDLFIGARGGCIGEVCIIALLAGVLFLLYKGYISLHTPLSFIGTVAIFSAFSGDWLFSILSGGLILGAFFMATDYVTGPLTRKGQIIFGIGCGLVTFVIRKWGGYPEGVSYSILIMNAFTPIIDRYTRLKIYGHRT